MGSCRTLEQLQLGSNNLRGGVGEGQGSACRDLCPEEDTSGRGIGPLAEELRAPVKRTWAGRAFLRGSHLTQVLGRQRAVSSVNIDKGQRQD